MLHYTSLACLLLLVSAVSSHNGEWRIRDHEAGPGKHFVIAPESNDDYSNFAVVEYGDVSQIWPPKWNVTFRVYNDHYNTQPKECSPRYRSRRHAKKAVVRSMNRLLDGNKLVLTWYDIMDDGDIITRIEVIDIDNKCRRIFDDRFLGEGHAIVVPSKLHQSKFDVIFKNAEICHGFDRYCRVSYDFIDNSFGSFGSRRPFSDIYDWSTLKAERLLNDDIILRGFDKTGDYQVKRLRPDGNNSTIMALTHENRNLQFVSSGTTFCWNSTGNGKNKFHCRQYNNENKINFTTTFEFDEPQELIDVRKIHDDELLLITKKKYCSDDCWKIYLTFVRENDRISKSYEFSCTGEQKDLMVFGVDYDDFREKVILRYACRHGNKYNFNLPYFRASNVSNHEIN